MNTELQASVIVWAAILYSFIDQEDVYKVS